MLREEKKKLCDSAFSAGEFDSYAITTTATHPVGSLNNVANNAPHGDGWGGVSGTHPSIALRKVMGGGGVSGTLPS